MELGAMTDKTHLGIGKPRRTRSRAMTGAILLGLLPWLVLCGASHADISDPVYLTDTPSAWDYGPCVATDGAGNWAAVWYSNDSTGGIGDDEDILVSYSTDPGATWSAPVALNTNAATDSLDDFEPQITYCDGHWVVVWYSGYYVGADYDILAAYGTYDAEGGADAGVWTWTDPVALNPDADIDTVNDTEPHLAVDGAGHWMCVWKRSGADYDIVASTGTVDGDTWTWTAPTAVDTDIPAPDGVEANPRVAGDGSGTWVVVWDPTCLDWDRPAMFSRSTDHGATWSAPAEIDITPDDEPNAENPHVTTDGAGNWVAVWEDFFGGDRDALFSRSTDNGITWSEPAGLKADYETDAANEYVPHVLADRTGLWIALWVAYNVWGSDGDILLSFSVDEGATWSFPTAFNTDAASESYSDYSPQAATDGAGNWVGVWIRPPSPGGPRDIMAASCTLPVIRTLDDLDAIRSNPSGEYTLANDIDASATADWNDGLGFEPIGTSGARFTGALYGARHTITGLYINRPDTSCVGLFGYSYDAIIENLWLEDVDITGSSQAGALVGLDRYSSIANCHTSGVVAGVNDVGGLLGSAISDVARCSSRCTVTGSGSEVGGLVGDFQGMMTRSFSTGPVSGTDYVGGLAGNSCEGEITDSYSRGAVSGNNVVGGFAGYSMITERCYSTGAVTGSGSDIGGLVGRVGYSAPVDCYWDTETSGQATSPGGEGKTTAEMKQQATFVNWDFATPIWSIVETVTYPYFAEYAPQVTINQAVAQPDPADALPVAFLVEFSQAVSGFDADDSDDVDVDFSSGTATVEGYTVTNTGDDKVFIVEVMELSSCGVIVAAIPGGVCQDEASLPNNPSTSTDNEVTYFSVPAVAGILRRGGSCSHVRDLSVDFEVTFTEAVTDVDAGDFSLADSTVAGAAITDIADMDGRTYFVTVDTGTGIGWVDLDLIDNDSIAGLCEVPLGGVGPNNGDFTEGETYFIDKTGLALGAEIPLPVGYAVDLDETYWEPADAVVREGDQLFVDKLGAFTVYWRDSEGNDLFCQEMATAVAVQSITRYDPALTHGRADTVAFRVKFSEPVTGVDATDFSLANSGVTGAAVTNVVDVDGQTYTVTVDTGSGRGLVQLDLVDDNSIVDVVGNALGGPEVGDGDYASGQKYAIDKTVYGIGAAIPLPLELEFFSHDDLILEDVTSVPVRTVNGKTVRNTIFIDSAAASGAYSGLFVGDSMAWNPHPLGYTTITWKYEDGAKAMQTFEQEILIGTDPAHEAMRLYLTDTEQGDTGAPKVSVLNAAIVKIHHNTQIRADYDPDPDLLGDEIRYLWVDAPAAQVKNLCARYYTGMVVVHFEDAGANFLGVQTVDVRPYAQDYTLTCDIGFEPAPHDPVDEDYRAWPPYVSRGKDLDINTAHVYQHEIPDCAKYGNVFAIRKTTAGDQVEIFWMRTSEGTAAGVRALGIEWPYEMTRYTFDWPTDPAKYQLYARGHDPVGVAVAVDNSLEFHADVMPYTEFEADFGVTQKPDVDGAFETDGPGWALVRYQTGSPVGSEDVLFTVVRSVYDDDVAFFPDQSAYEWPIGTEVMDAYHDPQPYHEYTEDPGGNLTQVPGTPGYIYVAAGSGEDRYDWAIYDGDDGDGAVITEAVTGQIFAVNTGVFEVWWYNEDPQGVAWPSFVKRYEAKWPHAMADLAPWPEATTEEIIIASTLGTGIIDYNTWEMYYQNDPERPGFNPNDEHAVLMSSVVYALRDDLGTEDTSLPYVLLKHRHPDTTELWLYTVYQVMAENATYTFSYPGTAGTLVQAPMPLSAMQVCEENVYVSGPAWEDRNYYHWVRAAGDDGGTAEIVMQYWYTTNESFYWPEDLAYGDYPRDLGAHVPWLDMRAGGVPGTPTDILFTVAWPDDVPTMKVGETLVKAKLGLPAVAGRLSANILYQQAEALELGTSVMLIDYKRTRPIDPPADDPVFIDPLPVDIESQFRQGLTFFPQLSPGLKPRLVYDDMAGQLGFRGFFVEPTLGEYYVFLNVMTPAEKTEARTLTTDPDWRSAIDALYLACEDVIEVPGDSMDFEGLALTAGFATAGGYVTLAFENAGDAAPLPVVLEIIRVVEEFAAGQIAAIYADCPFDERLVLMHKGDFNGHPEEYQFQWRTLPDQDGTPPDVPFENWNAFTTDPVDGVGAHSIEISGPGVFTLSDNWFVCRYRRKQSDRKAWPDDWSPWTEAQLAEGWIKRVVGEINPFTQRASGGGIEGAEVAFSSFADSEVNTVVSMISQAGPRWGGDVPMNCLNLDDYGLLEIYETVYGRGIELSIDATPPVADYEPANKALLLVAGRVADLYMLLGNEAYADAADPTIAYGTEDGTYGAESTSIHCFMNQTSSLIEEELGLLRGRDDALMPPVSTIPVYNRLVWNFTGDITGGEVAYALNYNIQDQNGNVDGTISEADAKALYPQGHGDAWGHYVSALKRYYKLLRHPNYAWVPRAEAVMVGGVPVTVDYMDERKFARAAAARAHAGSEITSLTYRAEYTEDPAGQWQGYRDDDPNRSWGVSEWACRAGMGAYFDWVTGNAILPPVDDDPDHQGIQKIDRTTVTELREVATAYTEVEAQIRKADTGLNPLGLARDVVPFDIAPAGIDEGKTHFEQIYERAVTALANAVTVFNHANNCTQLLRRQADSITDFQQTTDDKEADFNNRLIEIFGYPYSDDIGPTGTYPTGYNGPDLYHFDVVEKSELLGEDIGDTSTFTVPLSQRYTTESGDVRNPAQIPEANWTDEDRAHVRTVSFHISKKGFGIVKDPDWTGQRRAPGEIQLARSDLLQAIGRFKQGQQEYDNLIADIEGQVQTITDKQGYLAGELAILGGQIVAHIGLDTLILGAHTAQLTFKRIAEKTDKTADTIAEAMPKTIGVIAGVAAGTISDMTAFARAAAKGAAGAVSTGFSIAADVSEVVEKGLEQAREIANLGTNMAIVGLRGAEAIGAEVDKLKALVRQEAVKRIELYTVAEAMQQASGRYLAAIARGTRLLDDRLRFRQQTAGQVQDFRYKDMAFRVFRNDALQKYQAQFDLAARYVYLTAKAYDYETNLLGGDTMAGQQFLSDIVRSRALGIFQDGQPLTGGHDPGLSDIMARMGLNFDLVLRGRLGFNNPQTETNRFSLRRELFRTADDDSIVTDEEKWRKTLRALVVDNILDLPEFQRYCRIFTPHLDEEPGIVIPFSTRVEFGMNFFGWPLGGGDSAYDSTNFATKVRSVGIWFANYDNLGGGMSNTPRVYLIPVGEDVMRSPTGEGTATREWTVLDQKLPVPFPIGSGDLANPDWIPQIDTLQEIFAEIRRYSSFRAYHDSGQFDPGETISDSRLIGRSVWNTRWLLIIPAGTLHSDREEGLARFIYGPELLGVRTGEGVSDILIFFQTYAYSGGKKAAGADDGAQAIVDVVVNDGLE